MVASKTPARSNVTNTEGGDGSFIDLQHPCSQISPKMRVKPGESYQKNLRKSIPKTKLSGIIVNSRQGVIKFFWDKRWKSALFPVPSAEYRTPPPGRRRLPTSVGGCQHRSAATIPQADRQSVMHKNYLLTAIQELRDQQVRFAPRDKKIEQSFQAETLFRTIQSDQFYPYRFVCATVTDYQFQSELYPDLLLEGGKLKHDLALLIDDLFYSAKVAQDEISEKVWTDKELGEQFNVSTKTISRWRKQGLIGRHLFFGKTCRVGFLQSSVDHFEAGNGELIHRSGRFSQLTDDEKNAIIRMARRLARSNTSATDVAKRIAREIGRSTETVRYTLKSFDENHSDLAIFPGLHSPLTPETRLKIYQQFRQRVPIETIAKTFNRTRVNIYRIVGQIRAHRILHFALDYIDNPQFAAYSEEELPIVLGPTPEVTATQTKPTRVSKNMPVFVPDKVEPESGSVGLGSLGRQYAIPVLTPAQEVHLFRKMNYLKYRASELRRTLDFNRPKTAILDEIEKLYDVAIKTKNEIVTANLRLVVSIAKRHVGEYATFFDLISDGNLALIRAVEKFDFARGNLFSTYATWAITRNFARTIPDERKHREHFIPGDSEFLNAAADSRTDMRLEEQYDIERKIQVAALLNELDEREQKIIVSRFGLSDGQSAQTLNEVGAEIGMTKERVRQIEIRALAKLRRRAEDEHLEMPGDD